MIFSLLTIHAGRLMVTMLTLLNSRNGNLNKWPNIMLKLAMALVRLLTLAHHQPHLVVLLLHLLLAILLLLPHHREISRYKYSMFL